METAMDYLHPVIAQSIKHWTPKPLPKQPSAHIRLLDVDLQVTYDYQPSERMTSTYPGCPASVEICEVYLLNAPGRVDVHPFLSEPVLRELEARVLRQLEES